MNENIIKVEAKIVESRYDLATNSVLVSLDIEGKRKAASISAESFIKFEASPEQSRSIMMEYSKSLKQRTLPLYIEMTAEQLEGDEPINV